MAFKSRTEHMASWNAASLAAVLIGAFTGDVAAGANDNPRVAFFGFALINTSLEPTKPVEVARLQMLDALLQEKLGASGRFRFVTIPPELLEEIAAGPGIWSCNGCERDFANRIDAQWAAWGTVQKVSNLILNINLYMEDAQTGKLEFAKSVDIRGNTDESWRHGLDYMLRHYVLDTSGTEEKRDGPKGAHGPPDEKRKK
jgi:hypothetical protein